jgi:hypothetical protein
MTTEHEKYETMIATLGRQFRESIALQAAQFGVTDEAMTKAIVLNLLGEERFTDGRAQEWQVRVRIYDNANSIDPLVESDPDLHPAQPGRTIVRGLGSVAKLIVDQVTAYHGTVCPGLEPQVLARKIRTLRTQMSYRGDGTGTFRAAYEVPSKFGSRYMTVRCDVQRVDRSRQSVPAWPRRDS